MLTFLSMKCLRFSGYQKCTVDLNALLKNNKLQDNRSSSIYCAMNHGSHTWGLPPDTPCWGSTRCLGPSSAGPADRAIVPSLAGYDHRPSHASTFPLACHTTPSTLEPPPSADMVSWKTLASTFSPSDPTWHGLVSGEQSYFLSFRWWQLPRATYVPWPTNKFLERAVPPVPNPSDSPPDPIPAFSLLCFGHQHHPENSSFPQRAALLSWLLISKLHLGDSFLFKPLFSSTQVYVVPGRHIKHPEKPQRSWARSFLCITNIAI